MCSSVEEGGVLLFNYIWRKHKDEGGKRTCGRLGWKRHPRRSGAIMAEVSTGALKVKTAALMVDSAVWEEPEKLLRDSGLCLGRF